MSDFALQRRMMVDGQLRTFDVTQAGVIEAMATIPREVFVDPTNRAIAYSDASLTVGVSRRRMLTPMVLARLIQTAGVGPEDRALDVACGTGYSSAVLGRLAAEVVALEAEEPAAREAGEILSAIGAANVRVVSGALGEGYAAGAPYDVILVNGSLGEEPKTLLAQLRDGGRLVCVQDQGGAGRAVLYLRSGVVTGARAVFNAAAPALAAFSPTPSFVF